MTDAVASNGRRIIFIDPSLGRTEGHHQAMAENYAALCSDFGRIMVLAGNKTTMALPIIEGAQFIPVFAYRLDDAFRVSFHGKAWMAHRALVALAKTALKLAGRPSGAPTPLRSNVAPLTAAQCVELVAPLGASRTLKEIAARLAPTAGDDVVVLNADPALIAGLVENAARWLSPHGPRLHLLFMYPEDDIFSPATAAGFAQLYRQLVQPSVRFYAESSPHAATLTRRLGALVHPLVSPMRIAALADPPDGAFTVAALGAARIDKGFLDLPSIAAATAALAPDIRFRVQGAKPAARLGAAEAVLRERANVTVIPPELSGGEYEAELTRAHIVLTPYDARRFSERGSGVIVDALAGGRPIICTKGSALEAALATGNGIAADGPESFAQAIVAARESYSVLLKAAQAQSRATLAEIRDSPLLNALRASA